MLAWDTTMKETCNKSVYVTCACACSCDECYCNFHSVGGVR